MKLWNNIVQTAMLGTAKRGVDENDLPEDIVMSVKSINGNEAIDAEEKFLQTAALAFNYRQSGITPENRPDANLPVARAEEKPYCNRDAVSVLKDILYEDSIGLLKIWLQYCFNKEQIITPYLIPVLLDKSVQHKLLKQLVQECIGNRGRWLSHFKNDWCFAKELNIEELWQTGTTAERKNIIQQLRLTEPAKAREWLQQTWMVENANTKNDLLATLSINLSGDDAEWLENILNEKSQKVKEQAMLLLKQIPSSRIVQKYQEVLRQVVTVKKEKGLLGLSSKNVLHFTMPGTIDESIFKTSLEELGRTKEFSDDEFILHQLIQSVPPVFWEQELLLTPLEIIRLFQKNESKKKFIPALAEAILRFKDVGWAIVFTQDLPIFYPGLMPLLPHEEQQLYANKFFNGNEDIIVNNALQMEQEWSTELTKNILQHTAKNYYNYNRSFYKRHIHLVPVRVVGILEKCTPPEEHIRAEWSNTSEYIIKLITLKIQTIKAFQ